MIAPDIQHLMSLLARVPGLGPRSSRRATLHLINHPQKMVDLQKALDAVAHNIHRCQVCGALDTQSPCTLCQDHLRDQRSLCIVAEVGDLWALERSLSYKGQYHVLGGLLSALEGIGPSELNCGALWTRIEKLLPDLQEVILALNATVEGQTTTHYLNEKLKVFPVQVTALAQGIPLGAELDYLDDGTLVTALFSRRVVS